MSKPSFKLVPQHGHSQAVAAGAFVRPPIKVVEVDKSVDGKLIHLAMAGKLQRAAKRSVQTQKKLGLAVTYKRGDQIVRQSADGKVEVIGTVKRRAFSVPPHVRIIGK